jgi:triphosphoribosyl-dephospho-CoA synthase
MSSAAEHARAERLRRAFIAACRAELMALKPGNVHVHAPGHGMTVEDFLRSAEAAATPLCTPSSGVGARILAAVEASWAVVPCNTNLGIVLLAAPIIAAAEKGNGPLEPRLRAVLERLTVDDARETYSAIRRANPAGLGAAPAQDVAAAPSVTLLEAMRLAADRDLIARQYATGFADVFAVGFSRTLQAHDAEWTTTLVYLNFLSRFPDSHIARKFGIDTAEAVRSEAAELVKRLPSVRGEAFQVLLDFDRSLKARGLNPGTSADLTVASLLAAEVAAI